jgi:hypothetical protein
MCDVSHSPVIVCCDTIYVQQPLLCVSIEHVDVTPTSVLPAALAYAGSSCIKYFTAASPCHRAYPDSYHYCHNCCCYLNCHKRLISLTLPITGTCEAGHYTAGDGTCTVCEGGQAAASTVRTGIAVLLCVAVAAFLAGMTYYLKAVFDSTKAPPSFAPAAGRHYRLTFSTLLAAIYHSSSQAICSVSALLTLLRY